MVYLEYEEYKRKYHEIQKQYDRILLENEELFQRTQIQGIDYGREKVNGGKGSNVMELYIAEKDFRKIDERLAEVKILLDGRKRLLDLKREELRDSKELVDKVYRMKYLDHLKVREISDKLCYSKTQLYRIVEKIDEEIAKL
ncbi:MAG: hypothetical protein J6Y78_17795 [Paludibacteraceae bacterium]|nr:hypothetical protein [Paludibacteraceae bacterium]